MSRWLGTVTQSQLSRIESGRNKLDTLDKLVHYARALKMPTDLLWFSLPDAASDPLPRVDSILALPDGPLVPAASIGAGSAVADALLKTLDNYSATDNLVGAHSLISVVPNQLQFIESLIDHARSRDRMHLLYVGARYAEFAGWVYQDTGALDAAMQMSNTALDFSQEAGNEAFGAYVLMRKSNIATDAGRSGLALKLANAALSSAERLSPRMRAVVLPQVSRSDGVTCKDPQGTPQLPPVPMVNSQRQSPSQRDSPVCQAIAPDDVAEVVVAGSGLSSQTLADVYGCNTS